MPDTATLFPLEDIEQSAKKQRTLAFYDAVKEEYRRLRSVQKLGVRLYSDEYIMAELSKKFFRAPRTIENILFNRV